VASSLAVQPDTLIEELRQSYPEARLVNGDPQLEAWLAPGTSC
jgi:hypothetical protein